jgi:hypothetical protein
MEIAIGVILIVTVFWILPTLVMIEKEIRQIGMDKRTCFKSVARLELLKELDTMRKDGNLTTENMEKQIDKLKDRGVM